MYGNKLNLTIFRDKKKDLISVLHFIKVLNLFKIEIEKFISCKMSPLMLFEFFNVFS